MSERSFTSEEAKAIGDAIGVPWDTVDLEQFRKGLPVELEHGAHDPRTDVTGSDQYLTGKIVWAHLNEFPDYYDRLEKMEAEADAYWSERKSK